MGFSQGSYDEFDETMAIAQLPGEMPVDFAQRTLAKIASVERSGRHFEALALLTGDHHDGPARAARRLIVLSLSTHASTHGASAALLLRADHRTSDEARSQLLELVAEATESSAGNGPGIRLRFEEPQATN